jgi:hypothetical protein
MQVLHISFGFHSKATKLNIGYFEMTYMWVLCLGLGLHFMLLKSPMVYIKMNLNMGVAFKVRYSYKFAIHAHVLIFTN